MLLARNAFAVVGDPDKDVFKWDGVTRSMEITVDGTSAQAKPTITYWNGLTGADGKVMDGLIEQFTNETGIKIERQVLGEPKAIVPAAKASTA